MATAKIVLIGCKLPHGLILDHPLDVSKKVELAGLNKAVIIGADCATTPVDGEFWETWKTVHKDHPAIKSGAIFEARTTEEVKAKSKELKAEKTGFEAMPQEAMGVKVANTKDDKERLPTLPLRPASTKRACICPMRTIRPCRI